MEYVWTVAFIIVLILALGLNVFSLPGIWVILALLGVWKLIFSDVAMTWTFWIFLCGLGALSELMEFGAQVWGTKKYGGSNKGNIGGIIGAIVGAIVAAPFLFGLGALPGALAGAFLGCYIVELVRGMPQAAASRAALGAFWGKMLGMAIKFGMGISIIVMAAGRIWPS